MKIFANIAVLLFLFFLATPTLVYIMADEEDSELSIVCSAEEEIHKDIKEVKAGPQVVFELSAFITVVKKNAIKSGNLQRHTNVFGDVFIPPPETV
jgi:hypothetical protein